MTQWVKALSAKPFYVLIISLNKTSLMHIHVVGRQDFLSSKGVICLLHIPSPSRHERVLYAIRWLSLHLGCRE